VRSLPFPAHDLRAARAHGLHGLLPGGPAQQDQRLALAEQMAYEAALKDLERHAKSFAGMGVVVLKGPLLALRTYEHPAQRPSSDVDLLVAPAEFRLAEDCLRAQGFVPADGAHEHFFRTRHHHVHFVHPSRLPVELHHAAYRGFGSVLSAEALCARSRLAPTRFGPLRVLAPADEWLYLAVHAAAHRFERLGWLYDLVRLDQTHDVDHALVDALAKQAGFGAAVAHARWLAARLFDVSFSGRVPLGLRARLVESLRAPAPSHRHDAVRRLAYTLILTDGALRAAAHLGRRVSSRIQGGEPRNAPSRRSP